MDFFLFGFYAHSGGPNEFCSQCTPVENDDMLKV